MWGALPVVLVGAFAARRIEKHIPPYELGLHESVVEAQSRTPGAGPHVGPCSIFPKDNIWNTPIDSLAKHPKSDAYIASMGNKKVHMDFAANLKYGVPYTLIPAGTPPARITFEYADESDGGNYPIPETAPIERNGEQGSDNHIILIDPRKCILYELFGTREVSKGVWTGGSGALWDLSKNDLRKSGLTSADGAGLPIFPGLIRYDEVESGEINHALRFTVPVTQGNFVWPARHKASSNMSPDVPPMGMRFRLKADFDISNFSKSNRVILRALKKYGMFLADNGSGVFLSGVSDKRWDDDDLHKMGAVTASDFEAVDEADLQKSSNSAAIDPAAVKH